MIMTFAELETSLEAMLVAQPNYSWRIFDYFTNLYKTGCRPTELYQIDKWQRMDATTIILTPSKNNYNRYINVAQLTPSFVDAIDTQIGYYDYVRYEKALYFHEKWYMYYNTKVATKDIDLYLHRHHYVKKLYLDGMPIDQVTLHMGWINPDMALNYINSVITYD